VDKFFRKLFKKQKPEPGTPASLKVDTRPAFYTSPASEAATAPLSEEQLAEMAMQTKRIEPMQLIAGAARDVGRTRERNEDSLFYHVSLIDAGQSSVPFGIFVVADGMGGHRYGAAASEAASRTMGNYLFGKLYNSLYATNPQPPSESLQEILQKGVQKAHENVVENAPGGGTTLTTVLSIGSQMTIAHVGDSRAYAIYLDGRMQVLTRDHSLVKRLEELGQITSEEAAVHPQKSMLYRALGQGDSPEPDVFSASMPHPGYLMICSDGLWGVVPQDRIFEIISDAPSPQRACQSLVDMANAAGGPDNISVILVRLSD
jgi:serine/threonine protein phosphatase PrpC